MYYQHSTQQGGNAVDYLVKIEGYTFDEAVKALISGEFRDEEEEKKCQKPSAVFDWADVQTSADMRRGIAYLVKTRKIDYDRVVKPLIADGNVFQEAGTANLLFPILADDGTVCGAEVEGTQSLRRFKGVKAGSNATIHGFSVKTDIEKTRFVLFFESAIDLLSFLDIARSTGKSLAGCMLVSMAGLKPDLVKHISTLTGAMTALCVDNDIAGQNFTEGLKTKIRGLIERKPDKRFKDWNEQLQEMRG
jgi:hypothetical protein